MPRPIPREAPVTSATGFIRRNIPTERAERKTESAEVAAGVSPAVEPGILPGGHARPNRKRVCTPTPKPGRQDAALHGWRDASRYNLSFYFARCSGKALFLS